MKLVLVEWYDACSGYAWESREDDTHIRKIISIGILEREDDKEIVIVPNISPVNKIHEFAIPRGCIRRIRQLCLK
jgi:hypothetical protein